MTLQFIDISVAIDNETPADPPPMRPAIQYKGHMEGAAEIASMFPGLDPADLPDGEGWAVEDVKLTTHNGTHLDAPWHFHSTMDGGKRAATIDEIPLDWCYAAGVKLDFRYLPDGHVVSAAEVEDELRRIEHNCAQRISCL